MGLMAETSRAALPTPAAAFQHGMSAYANNDYSEAASSYERSMGFFDQRGYKLGQAELYEAQGLYEHEVYPGVHMLLARLKRQGHRIYIVSAKPTSFARRLTFQFDLNLVFDDIFGSSLKGEWQPKTAVLERLRQQGTIWPGGYMIGDRGDDMRAARDHGLHAIGVTYGYGSREELLEAGAEVLLDSIPELDAWLREEITDPEAFDAFNRAE